MKGGKIKVQIVGDAGSEVTGSCVWVKTPHIEFLIECGLYQNGSDTLKEYQINGSHFDFKPQNISYVFGCHCHSDHINRVPLLYKRGMKGAFIMPKGSEAISRILMEDCAKIMTSDAEKLSKLYKRNYQPIYTQDDVDNCLSHLKEYEIGNWVRLDDYVKFRFVPSGHILNAAQLEVAVTEGNITKVIGYTSDLGNTHVHRSFVNQFTPIEKANCLIAETTYGAEKRIASQSVRNKDIEKIKFAIRDTCETRGGRVLIPCFANARSQEILTVLYDLFGNDQSFRIPIIFDTPMGIRVCEAYKKLLSGTDKEHFENVISWRNIEFVVDASASAKNQSMVNNPAVIISSSGMLTNGRSKEYAKRLLPGDQNLILFCGYSVDDSLASAIKRGDSKVLKIGRRKIENKCRVIDLHSFTSHMQRDDLLDYYSSVECEKVILVHGEMSGKLQFADDLEIAISKKDKTSKVVCATKGYSINL